MSTTHTHPLLMVDVVLLTLVEGSLHVGLAQRTNSDEPFHGAWTIPGGFVRPQEDQTAEDTVRRVLLQKAGVRSPYVEQLYTFSGALRDSRGWSASIAHYALVPAHVAPAGSAVFRWAPVASIKHLPFDHMEILDKALERVRSKTSYSALPLYLAPEEFTMTQLRAIYEQVLGGELDHRGFERRMFELEILEPTGAMSVAARGKPARLYRPVRAKAGAQLAPSFMTR